MSPTLFGTLLGLVVVGLALIPIWITTPAIGLPAILVVGALAMTLAVFA